MHDDHRVYRYTVEGLDIVSPEVTTLHETDDFDIAVILAKRELADENGAPMVRIYDVVNDIEIPLKGRRS